MLDNYGFLPDGFDADVETIKHVRTFTITIKARLEFNRTTETDPTVLEEYTQWADSLFNGLAKYLEQ